MTTAIQQTPSPFVYDNINPFNDDQFAILYAIYSDLFPLSDEREPPSAFRELAELNSRQDVQNLYGPWQEFVFGMRLDRQGALVGGNVFGVTTSQAHVNFGCQASVHDIYLFVHPNARGHGAMANAKAHMESHALAVFGLNPGIFAPLIFLEVNNPTLMSSSEIDLDTVQSGIHPCRRYMSWKRSGFRPLDFRYVQPALRPDASAIRYLNLFCSGGAFDSIPAEVILAHLKAFISVSVLKGRPASENPDFEFMARQLTAGKMIRFVSDDAADQKLIAEKAGMLARSTISNTP
jgi:hypothetical protein